jgi:hypothetical protein
MAEPVSTTTSAVTGVGLAALLTGAVGAVAADVMMVILASIAGVVIALSNKKTSSFEAVKFFGGAVLTSLVLAWALAALLASLHSSMNSPYAPTIIAFLIGTQSHRLDKIAAKITGRIEKKIEGDDK